MDSQKSSFDPDALKTCGFCKKSQRHKTIEDLQKHVTECQKLYENFEAGIKRLIEKSDPDKMCILIVPGYVSFIKGSDAHSTLLTLVNPKSWSILRKRTAGGSICVVPIEEDNVVVI